MKYLFKTCLILSLLFLVCTAKTKRPRPKAPAPPRVELPKPIEPVKQAIEEQGSCLSDEYEYLNGLALWAGTDKASSGHNYTEIYAQHFAALRHQPMKFLEIGICAGASVKLWESYFPNATLHFIDNNNSSIQYFSSRAQYHFLDQENAPALIAFANQAGGNFDIIIDDGGHTMRQQIVSFETLFPYLKSGGLYIIEDLHTSYWKQWGGHGTFSNPAAGPGTTVEFLKKLVEDVNYPGAAEGGYWEWARTPPFMRVKLNNYQQDIYSIQFYKSLCVIKKR